MYPLPAAQAKHNPSHPSNRQYFIREYMKCEGSVKGLTDDETFERLTFGQGYPITQMQLADDLDTLVTDGSLIYAKGKYFYKTFE